MSATDILVIINIIALIVFAVFAFQFWREQKRFARALDAFEKLMRKDEPQP